MKDISFISDIIHEKLLECGVWSSLSRGTSRTSSTTTARRYLSGRRSQTNSHVNMLTDILLDETPDIFSDNKNFLIVHLMEVFHGKEKKNGVYVSVYLHNRDAKFVGVSSWVLSLVYREKVGNAKPFTKVGKTAVSKIVSHTSTRSSYNSLPPQRETPPLPDPRHQH